MGKYIPLRFTINQKMPAITESQNAELNKLLIERIADDTEQYVLYKSGKLSESQRIKGNIISWNVPYANRRYHDIFVNVSTYVHPNATPKWLDYAYEIHSGEWKEYIRDLINDLLGKV